MSLINGLASLENLGLRRRALGCFVDELLQFLNFKIIFRQLAGSDYAPESES